VGFKTAILNPREENVFRESAHLFARVKDQPRLFFAEA
jgi:hypothetical protein